MAGREIHPAYGRADDEGVVKVVDLTLVSGGSMEATDPNIVEDWPAENVRILEAQLAGIAEGGLAGMPQADIDDIVASLERQLTSARKILELSRNAD